MDDGSLFQSKQVSDKDVRMSWTTTALLLQLGCLAILLNLLLMIGGVDHLEGFKSHSWSEAKISAQDI